MATTPGVSFDAARHPEEEPIVFTGEPSRLRGQVALRNAGPERVVVRHALLRSAPLHEACRTAGIVSPGEELGSRGERHAAPAIVPPDGRSDVRLSLDLGPHTPPGSFAGEIEIEGQIRPVRLEIASSVGLSFSPANVVVLERGEAVVVSVVAQNRGNVPIPLPESIGLPLDDEVLVCRTVRGVLEELGEETIDVGAIVGQLARQTREVLRRSGVLGLRNLDPPYVLNPGEGRTLRFELRMPPALDVRTRYFAYLPVADQTLTFVLAPTFAQAVQQPKPREAKKK